MVAEIALALMLVAGAGLLLRSFQRLVAIEPGFEPENRLVMQMWLAVPNEAEKGRFFTVQQRQSFYTRVRDAVAQAEGVRDAALVSRLPFRGRSNFTFEVEGRPVPDEARPRTEVRTVSPNYFATMGIPLLRGAGLPAFEDSAASQNTIVINQEFAAKHFPNDDPIGRRIKAGRGPQAPWFTIGGVVGSVRNVSLEQPPVEEVYLSYRRSAGHEMALVVHTASDPDDARNAVLHAVRTVDAEQPVFGMMSMQRLLDDANAPRRFSLLLLTLFASIALLLSAIGIYGVMAYTTAQRQHEIGIRLALGALPSDVVRQVLGRGMRMVAIGVAIGLAGAWALSRVLRGQLFEITAADPVTYGGAALLLGLVALAANYIPALRASRANPLASIRTE